MSDKTIPQPHWWKNTYFWIAAVLAIIAMIGMIGGEGLIRDPGQKKEGYLSLIYLGGSIIMLVNGYLSHRQTIMHYLEQQQSTPKGDTDGSM